MSAERPPCCESPPRIPWHGERPSVRAASDSAGLYSRQFLIERRQGAAGMDKTEAAAFFASVRGGAAAWSKMLGAQQLSGDGVPRRDADANAATLAFLTPCGSSVGRSSQRVEAPILESQLVPWCSLLRDLCEVLPNFLADGTVGEDAVAKLRPPGGNWQRVSVQRLMLANHTLSWPRGVRQAGRMLLRRWAMFGLWTLCLASLALAPPGFPDPSCRSWLQPLFDGRLSWVEAIGQPWPLFGWAYAAQLALTARLGIPEQGTSLCDSISSAADLTFMCELRRALNDQRGAHSFDAFVDISCPLGRSAWAIGELLATLENRPSALGPGAWARRLALAQQQFAKWALWAKVGVGPGYDQECFRNPSPPLGLYGWRWHDYTAPGSRGQVTAPILVWKRSPRLFPPPRQESSCPTAAAAAACAKQLQKPGAVGIGLGRSWVLRWVAVICPPPLLCQTTSPTRTVRLGAEF